MPIDRRVFLASLAAPLLPSPAGGAPAKPYGSGHFGAWIEDEFGLPAFRYTCDQATDPKAITHVGPGILSATEHIHQIGNDRIVAIASNYGHVRVRQDEGSPKFLNAHSPDRGQFAGGFGYLTDGRETLSTYYPGGGRRKFERIFGIGYFRKRVAGDRYAVDQIISAPFGDDPVLLSQVTIANNGTEHAQLRWAEYWGCFVYQFSFRAFMEVASGIGTPNDLRRKFGDRFRHRFTRLPGDAGLMETKHFEGYDPAEQATFERVCGFLKTSPNPFLTAPKEAAPGAAFDDLNPPSTFLASLDAPADAMTTQAKRFFGAGGVENPIGLAGPLDGDLAAPGNEGGLLIERRITLAPGQQRTLYFLYGYQPTGADAGALIAKYRRNTKTVLAESSRQWRSAGLRFSVPGEPWIERETIWNHYYLRSSLTYDDFFKEHILSQGAIYQYFMGFQGAARDPLQHAMPFVFSDPQIVRDVLRYTLKEVRADGSLPYGIVGHGMVMPTTSDNASDLPMWLLWAVSEYVLATRDQAFLDEQIPLLLEGDGTAKESVRNLLARCYRHLVADVGQGEHGLMRMLQDDWNDALVIMWAQSHAQECVAKGESVLNSAMASWVFDYYARLLAYDGAEPAATAGVRDHAEAHRKATRAQWTGKWFRRAWLGPTLGWLGETTLWIEPQPWAIIGGAAGAEESRDLVRTMDEMLRRPSPIGAMQIAQGPDTKRTTTEPGTSVNGGVWPSLNQTLVWALAQVDRAMGTNSAWDEWVKNSLARHADVYPDIWYNTWSGGDTINSAISKHPGQTVDEPFLRYTDFPVMNLHSHACSMYSIAKLLGLVFTETGIEVAPVIPSAAYRFESPLIGIVKTAAGYEGWYAPSKPGKWTIRLRLPAAELAALTHGEVNGHRVRVSPEVGVIELRGDGAKIRWSLRRTAG